jgi:hypothetical protein
MNSGYSTPNTGLPHLSHAEPWAHSFICCDSDHAASTSRGSTPVTRFSGQHQSQPSTSTACSFDPTAAACCDEAKCPEGDHVECCTDPACNEGAICEDEGCHVPHGGGLSATDFGSEENMRELEEWACSKEGNHAIQQYVSRPPTLSYMRSPPTYLCTLPEVRDCCPAVPPIAFQTFHSLHQLLQTSHFPHRSFLTPLNEADCPVAMLHSRRLRPACLYRSSPGACSL